MRERINYVLAAFGYRGVEDFKHTVFKMMYSGEKSMWIKISAGLGTFRLVLFDFTGLDVVVFFAFVFLIMAEFQTGLKVALIKKKEKFQSRKFGRMILKISVYVLLIGMLHAFANRFRVPEIYGLEVNPFIWLYYVVFIAIVVQLVVSWLENLGQLGYKESKTLAGIILRRFNKWFEFDGEKDNDY
jgi:hypothetical protein